MYEIWLVLNIVWEIALGIWPLLAAATLLWLVLMVTAWRRPGTRWRAALPVTLGLALAVGLVGLVGVPSTVGSSLKEMGYWVDWANLFAIAAGVAAAAAAFAWPLLAMRRHA